jgi:hypothetical protein
MPDLNASRIFKLCAPLLLTALYVGVLGATRRINRITLFQAAMGPQEQIRFRFRESSAVSHDGLTVS